MWPSVTRFSVVCLRFDDYHQDVDHETWVDVLSRYEDAGLRGVIGVVPKYEGERLSADVVEFLHDLQEKGWELAQHGYTHENVGDGRGGPLYDDRSEFAGLGYEEQHRRIQAGRDILESHGIEPTTFIPPWHEYDRTTARVLSNAGFDCLNEGRWPVPRTVDGITLVPTHVPGVTPYMLGVGVVTLVSHPQLESEPMRNAEAVAGYENRVRTPSEVVEWWRYDSATGRLVDATEPLYSLHSY
jgi:peptidoglycan/xylan/chitin deacetylase (PgdA/CDA1 family)